MAPSVMVKTQLFFSFVVSSPGYDLDLSELSFDVKSVKVPYFLFQMIYMVFTLKKVNCARNRMYFFPV